LLLLSPAFSVLAHPKIIKASVVAIRTGENCNRNELLGRLADIQYTRNDVDFARGTFRVRGDVVELHPSYESFAVRIELLRRRNRKDKLYKSHISRNPCRRRTALYISGSALHYAV